MRKINFKKVIVYFFLFIMVQFYNITFTDAQEIDDIDIYTVIYLDSLTVTAKRKGFDVDDFIDLVMEDKSFYKAFKNLRTTSYRFDAEMEMKDKKKRIKATYESKMVQESDGRCRTMEVISEKETGNFYKRKKKYRYYTAKLLDRLFYTHGKYCEENVSGETIPNATPYKSSKMEEYVSELKQLIFDPGEKINVPFIGKKTEIFDPKMIKYYDYSITSQQYVDGRDCYVFSVRIKPEYTTRKEDKTVIKFLETYFDKENFQVVARNYQLKYNHLAFDFDVTMKIQLEQIKGHYFPTLVQYDGNWDIPTRKPEIGQFEIRLYDFKLN